VLDGEPVGVLVLERHSDQVAELSLQRVGGTGGGTAAP
jgi:hypothetical protein